jgi:hypothetical protein
MNGIPQNTGRRPVWVVWLGGILLVAISAFCLFERFRIGLRVAFAEEQTAIFDEMRAKIETANPENGIEFLEYAVSYFPTGTKQIMGSRLDQIVERERRSAVREMIATLRKKTGQDFGDDPQAWLNHRSSLKRR